MIKRSFYFLTAFIILFSGFRFFSIMSKAYNAIGINVNGAYYTIVNSYYLVNGRYDLSSSNNVYVVFYKLPSFTGYQVSYVFFSKDLNSVVTHKQVSGNNVGSASNTTLNKNYNNEFYYSQLTGSFWREINGTNVPILSVSSHDEILEIISNGYIPDKDLGYIQNVGYHVDSYGLENNPTGTNELISWANESTTGIDLSLPQYSVEFALKDKTTNYRRTLSNEEWFPVLPYSLNEAFKVAEDTFSYLASNFFKNGDDKQAILRGNAGISNDTYGKMVSLGSTLAQNRRFSFNAIDKYKTSSVYDTNDQSFKNYIDDLYTTGTTRTNIWAKAGEWWNSQQIGWNISYDIMARIVDNSTGQKGDWLVINKHNTPYIMSDRADRLNGGVTSVVGVRIPNYDPQPDFDTPPAFEPSVPDPNNPEGDPIFLPQPVNTGYVYVKEGDTINEGDIVNYYYNTVYNYGDTIINNNYPSVDDPIYIPADPDNDDSEPTQTNTPETADYAMRLMKKVFPKYTEWFQKLFGPLLPKWARHMIIVFVPISIISIIFKIAKHLLPLLADLFLGLNLPRLPGD